MSSDSTTDTTPTRAPRRPRDFCAAAVNERSVAPDDKHIENTDGDRDSLDRDKDGSEDAARTIRQLTNWHFGPVVLGVVAVPLALGRNHP